jgi:hypothetical protein
MWGASVNAMLALYSSIGGTAVLQIREPTRVDKYENHVMLFSAPCSSKGSSSKAALARQLENELGRFGEVRVITAEQRRVGIDGHMHRVGQRDPARYERRRWRARAHVAFTSTEAAAACVTQLTREGYEVAPYSNPAPYNKRGWVHIAPCLDHSPCG